jgi:hypothetical protein
MQYPSYHGPLAVILALALYLKLPSYQLTEVPYGSPQTRNT